MKEETADQYIAVIKRALATIDEAIAQIAEGTGAKTPEELEGVNRGMQFVPAMQILDVNGKAVPLRKPSGEVDYNAFKEALLRSPQPSRVQQAAALEMCDSLPVVMRRAFAKTTKKLPHAPGGHPFALKDPELRLAICKRIETYRIKNHMDTAKAIQRVASDLKRQQRSVSTKTLSRYYERFLREQDDAPRGRKRK